MLKFTKSHEWVDLQGDIAAIGISEYAQGQLGDIVFIELPKPGDKLKQFFQFGTIESTKAASELFSPLSGEVVAVNIDLTHNPQWINESAQSSGWMLKVKIANPEELNNLMDETTYREFAEKEKK